ncbi:MAG: AarF/ABC1/UbiB kinase family protein, partial [Solirubrobacterales bacterium]|nr:AarF/ABC1/UbiB kinase family protein [Solirubrobacterales bacterium]
RTEPSAIAGAQRLVRRGGPAYIKLGQFIASADGILPPAWVEAFAWCRDDAPRLPFATVRSILARELGEDALAAVDEDALAAGSIGQVHRAWLADGTAVVVKVRRPGLPRRLRSDIGALALAAAGAERMNSEVSALNLPGFVELFAQLTLEELDFRLEALNLVQSAEIYEACGLDFVQVPRPVAGLVTERVLVMEHVAGVPYDRAAQELDADVDGERLLQVAIGGVLTSTLAHGLFHGDLHAGNVLVRRDGSFALVDFGICGRLDERQRASLGAYLMAFAAGDAAGQIAALRRFGAIPADADEPALVAELGAELERLGVRADGAVTFERLGQTVGRQLSILARSGFRMPKELVLFFKNLLYLSSFAAAVAPEADLFAVVERALGDVGGARAVAGAAPAGADA